MKRIITIAVLTAATLGQAHAYSGGEMSQVQGREFKSHPFAGPPSFAFGRGRKSCPIPLI